jgi:hypothetical protein
MMSCLTVKNHFATLSGLYLTHFGIVPHTCAEALGCIQHSCSFLCSALYLSVCIQNSALDLCVLNSDLISSHY